MIQTEFVRSLQSNYARIMLSEKPQENRYQYCILNRGSIKGLLPCSLRYINGSAYLYYDITSKQSVEQMFGRKCIDRDWLKDFMWSIDRTRQELERFLLNDQNIIWHPAQVYQDLEQNLFYFLYVPYYEGGVSFLAMLDFWIENIDYEDEVLVECVYKMYEKYEQNGDAYLQKAIFEDLKILDKDICFAERMSNDEKASEWIEANSEVNEYTPREDGKTVDFEHIQNVQGAKNDSQKGIRHFWEGRKRRNKEQREDYYKNMELQMNGYAVAEETVYEKEEYGRTIYIEETPSDQPRLHRLMSLDGRMLAQLDKSKLLIGKKKDEVDLVLEGASVSRLHAKIILDKDDIYIEDLNSTNGTFCNGFRLLPYEKKRLEEGDELKFGKVIVMFR